MIPWWLTLAWIASIVAAYFGGALSYHWVRLLATRSAIYKPRYADAEKMKARRDAIKADKEARDMAHSYLNGLDMTREEYLGELGPGGAKK